MRKILFVLATVVALLAMSAPAQALRAYVATETRTVGNHTQTRTCTSIPQWVSNKDWRYGKIRVTKRCSRWRNV